MERVPVRPSLVRRPGRRVAQARLYRICFHDLPPTTIVQRCDKGQATTSIDGVFFLSQNNGIEASISRLVSRLVQ
jgi:hypothetical protein